jgi:hypothetical protein
MIYRETQNHLYKVIFLKRHIIDNVKICRSTIRIRSQIHINGYPVLSWTTPICAVLIDIWDFGENTSQISIGIGSPKRTLVQ